MWVTIIFLLFFPFRPSDMAVMAVLSNNIVTLNKVGFLVYVRLVNHNVESVVAFMILFKIQPWCSLNTCIQQFIWYEDISTS